MLCKSLVLHGANVKSAFLEKLFQADIQPREHSWTGHSMEMLQEMKSCLTEFCLFLGTGAVSLHGLHSREKWLA